MFLPIPGIVRVLDAVRTDRLMRRVPHFGGCIVCCWSPIPPAYAAIPGIGGIVVFYGASLVGVVTIGKKSRIVLPRLCGR